MALRLPLRTAGILAGVALIAGAPVRGANPSGPPRSAVLSPAPEAIRRLIEERRFSEAEAVLGRALAAADSDRGHPGLDTAHLLDLLVEARLQAGRGGAAQTLDLARRAIAIKKSLPGCDPAEISAGQQRLARILYLRENQEAAIGHYRYMATERERRLGATGPDLATTLNTLGLALLEHGEPREARGILERALRIQTVALGARGLPSARTLSILALVRLDLGDREGARDAWTRATAIWESELAADPPRLALSLEDLARDLADRGDWEGARPLCERAVALWRSDPGSDPLFLARPLALLARVEHRLGNLDDAAAHYAQAAPVVAGAADLPGDEKAAVLASWAELLALRGEEDRASRLAAQASALYAGDPQVGSPEAARDQGILARDLLLRGDRDNALDAALRALAVERENMRLAAAALPERVTLTEVAARSPAMDVALSIAGQSADPSIADRVCDALIRSRALLLDEKAAGNQMLSELDHPVMARLYDTFTAAEEEVARIKVAGVEGGSQDRPPGDLSEAEAERDRAEAALAERSLVFRSERARRKAGVIEVRDALPAGSALIAYAAFAGEGTGSATPSYLAFVVRGDRPHAAVVPLGSKAEIDRSIAVWWGEASRDPELTPDPGNTRYRRAGTDLRRRIWDPLAPGLRGIRRVFVVPDGPLHQVSVAALPSGRDRYLLETGPVVHYLSAERDLVLPHRAIRDGRGLLAVGGVDFDASADGEGRPGSSAEAHRAGSRPFRGELPPCEAFNALRFAPLPASRAEVDDVARLWEGNPASSVPNAGDSGVVRLTGARATEGALKALAPGRAILHFATHGFYLDGLCTPEAPGTRGIGKLAADSEPGEPATDPLELSGLALAGANRRRAGAPGSEDGILTAEEVAALDLHGVSWAVLSGCETGLGEVRTGEGVFGLRRAFEEAGVGTLIMALWPVEDEPAREWMRDLYAARFESGRQTSDAVREAALALLESRRRRGESTHPFTWGAFVATGDWR